MSIAAKVIAHSRGPNTAEISTLQVRMPRFILAQFNTHRAISKNARSSRAVPVEKLILEAETNPVIPLSWGRNRRGMQATEELNRTEAWRSEAAWLDARDHAVACAHQLLAIGAHKQIVNRLLEPFLWVDVVATATDWSNFFALRCDRHAQPEMQAVAVAMARALRDSEPSHLGPGMWHLPYVTADELDLLHELQEEAYNAQKLECVGRWFEEENRCLKLSVGRCARVSYLPFQGGEANPEADIKLHDRLEANGHWSPFEHQARSNAYHVGHSGNFLNWTQYRQTLKKSVHTSFDYASLDTFGEQGYVLDEVAA